MMEIVSEATAHWVKCRHDEATEALRDAGKDQRATEGLWTVKEQINSWASPGKQKYVVKGLYLQPSW
jgi:hypothetical protein